MVVTQGLLVNGMMWKPIFLAWWFLHDLMLRSSSIFFSLAKFTWFFYIFVLFLKYSFFSFVLLINFWPYMPAWSCEWKVVCTHNYIKKCFLYILWNSSKWKAAWRYKQDRNCSQNILPNYYTKCTTINLVPMLILLKPCLLPEVLIRAYWKMEQSLGPGFPLFFACWFTFYQFNILENHFK